MIWVARRSGGGWGSLYKPHECSSISLNPFERDKERARELGKKKLGSAKKEKKRERKKRGLVALCYSPKEGRREQ